MKLKVLNVAAFDSHRNIASQNGLSCAILVPQRFVDDVWRAVGMWYEDAASHLPLEVYRKVRETVSKHLPFTLFGVEFVPMLRGVFKVPTFVRSDGFIEPFPYLLVEKDYDSPVEVE